MPGGTTRRAALIAAASLAALGAAHAQPSPPPPADSPVRIGLLLGLTGALAQASEDIAYGFALALDEVDRKAGGRALHVAVADTFGRSSRTAAQFLRLVQEEKVDIVVGPTSSPEALVVRDAAHEAGIPVIVPNAGVSALAGEKCSPFVVRVSYANDQIAGPLGTWMMRSGRAKSAYLLAADNPSGRDHVAAFRRSFIAAGGEVTGEELVPPTTRDLSPYLGKLKLVRTEAIFASFFGDAAQLFLDGAEQFGLRTLKICGPGWLVSTLDLAKVGSRAAGIIGATAYLADLDIASNRAFVDAFTQRHTRPPTEFAAQGYDAGRLLIATLDALEGNVANRRAVAALLARTPFIGARGRLAIDPRTNNVIQDIHVFETRKRPGGEGIEFAPLARIPDVSASADQCQMG
ncbi:MAG: penicillin-binding protein activator [Alphaproteobacteria bacterium]|nr:penicillin-binding protein activator [Alphaproteobacteria bacterium]